MPLPPLVKYNSEEEYKQHYIENYCNATIFTFDNIRVDFYPRQFHDAFFESSCKLKKTKDIFSKKRAKRIDWIKYALQDSKAELHVGWDRKKKRIDPKRRVCIIAGDYVVVIQMKSQARAFFVTAFVADSLNTLREIRSMLKWK